MRNTIGKSIDRTEKAFVDALVTLLKKNSIEAISVSDICNIAGYSRNTFYRHYETKDLFIKAILDHGIDMFMNSLNHEYDGSETQQDFSIRLNTQLFSYVYDNREFYSLLLENRLYADSYDYFINGLFERLREKITRKQLDTNLIVENNLLTPDMDMIYYLRASEYINILTYWKKHDFSFSPYYIAVQKSNFEQPMTSRAFQDKREEFITNNEK